LVDQREAARKARDWKRADAIRADLGSRGVLVEDGPEGPKLKRS
jgi:cysteinyl-tRNA synthetase